MAGKIYSVAQARGNLTGILHAVEAGESVHITRRGKPVAILLSAQEYSRLKGQSKRKRDFWSALRELRNAPDFVPLGLTQEEVDSWRDREPGREFSWTD